MVVFFSFSTAFADSGDQVLPKLLTFPDYNDEEISSYTAEWTATVDGAIWTLNGFNNNKNAWNWVKCGRKTTAQTATILSPAFQASVTDVVYTVDKTSNVTKATVTVLNGEEAVTEIDITEQFVAGDVDVKVEGAPGYSYLLTIESDDQASANGPTQISKVGLYGEGQYVVKHIANTADDPYTVAEAIELIDAGDALSETVFVKGIISQIDEVSEEYGNATYWISDDGTTATQLECYRGLYIDGEKFTSADQLEVGAIVVVTGTLTKYGSTYEFAQGNKLVSYSVITINPDDPELVAPEGWISEITNGNLAGDDVANYIAKEYPSTTPAGAAIVAGAGYNNSRGIVVKSQDKAKEAWDTQFWINLNEPLADGTLLHVEFDYRADNAGSVGTQSHGEPGAYQHWAAIGNVDFTTEWQHFNKDVTVEGSMANMLSIALNLNDIAEANNYYFDNFGVWVQKPAPVDEWADIIINGDMEGESMECFYVTEQGVGGPFVAIADEGIGKDGGKAVKVQSADNPAQDWDSQFFIRLPYQLPAGTKYRVSFDYKADKAGDFDTQAHAEPGDYIHWACIGSGSFTDEWQTYEKEGSISADMSTAEKPMQTIAFNLAKNKAATRFVFDNVKFEIEKSVAGTLTPNPAENATPYPVGIMDVNADENAESIYNLSGQKVMKTDKGLYIVNGKKVMVK